MLKLDDITQNIPHSKSSKISDKKVEVIIFEIKFS